MGNVSSGGTQPGARVISTPDQRLRVFVSSTLEELAPERDAAKQAIGTLRLAPVMFELGARPHPPVELYRSYLGQSDVFVGIYWQSYGWVAPNAQTSGIEDEYEHSSGLPRLIYIKEPAPARDERLQALLDRIRDDGSASYRKFRTPDELSQLLVDDLALLITERFHNSNDGPAGGGTITFLFVDLEGSTPLVQTLGDQYSRLLHDYHAIVTSSANEHHGKVVSTEGDGLFCVFTGPVDAVDAAHAIHLEVAARTWPAKSNPRCRIGVHTGVATRTMEGYVGLDVHRAARIGAAAQGGQTIVSATTRDLIEDLVASRGWRLVDLGLFDLEGISRSERLLRLDMPDLPVVLTSPRAKPKAPLTLPRPARRLIGRLADLRGAAEMVMRDSVRMVTLTGPGGTGKTRLAIEVAHRLKEEFPDGVVFVDLSAVREPDRFLPTVAWALGVRESAERPLLEGLKAVVGSARMLLVLDNMEQLVEAGPTLGTLLETLPDVRVLVTSRAPLRLSWENEYPLSPLQVPEPKTTEQAIREADSVALFLERAQAVRPGFDLDAENQEAVAEIVRRLDGLPLAVELAAARLRVFTPQALLERLGDRLDILDRGAQDAPERHRTLRGTVQWSHDLLDDEEKTVFRRLAVFAGGWSLEAAVELCCDERLSETRVLDLLEELVTKSLVVFYLDEDGVSRYRMLETLREFAMEKLRESGEEEVFRRRHLAWCLQFSARVMNVLPTPEFPRFLDEVERDRFNIREALQWSIDTGSQTAEALEICGLLPLFWDTRGYVTEGVDFTRRLISNTEGAGDSRERGMALAGLGWLAMLAGDPEESERALVAADQMFRDIGDENWLGRSLAMHGMTTYNRDDLDTAERQFQEAIELCRKFDLDWLADAWCAYGLAHIALARNEFAVADSLLRQSLEFCRKSGLTWGTGHVQFSLGVLAFMTGDQSQAMERLSESLGVRQDLKDARGICDCLGMMALLASVRGDHRHAAVMLGAAEVAREAFGHRPVPWLQPMLEMATDSAKAALESEFETHLAEGRDLSVPEAIHLALEARRLPVEVGAASVA